MADKARRILIVDDDPDILANLADILTDIGYDTDVAANGEDAIGILTKENSEAASERYDLCLLDFKMPGMDGVELYKKILAHNPELRAIMITAYAGDDGIQRAQDAGTWRVLRKPVDIKLLLEMIGEATAEKADTDS